MSDSIYLPVAEHCRRLFIFYCYFYSARSRNVNIGFRVGNSIGTLFEQLGVLISIGWLLLLIMQFEYTNRYLRLCEMKLNQLAIDFHRGHFASVFISYNEFIQVRL